MKLIDALQKLSKGEIKEGTILTKGCRQYKYIDNCFLDDYHFPLTVYSENDLNSDVTITEPEPKRYYLKLYENNDFSYINLNHQYNYCKTGTQFETDNLKTKFTQDEIDGNMLLKFIEKYAIKEEVEQFLKKKRKKLSD